VKKTHCKRGHDKGAVGRAKDGGCMQCRRDRWNASRAANIYKDRARTAAWHAANPEKMRLAVRRYAGIIGLPDVEAKPGHPCDCCGRPIPGTPRADHDHATGQFRGWLCNPCNTGLGHVERPGWLDSAVAYLAKTGRLR